MNTRTPSRTLALATLTLSLALAVGCQPNTKAPPGARADPLPPDEYPNVTVEAPLNQFVVASPGIVDMSTGIMRVSVPVRLTSNSTEANIQYRFLFFDDRGIELRQQPGWRHMLLPVRTEVQLAGSAMDNTAHGYRLEIRSGR